MKLYTTSLFICGFFIVLQSCNNTRPANGHAAGLTVSDTVPRVSTPTPLPLVETHWKLIELNGTAVNITAEKNREPHLRLTPADNRITGNGGCNGFSGKYLLEDPDRIRFMEVASTKMACDHMEIEAQFFNVLYTADNFSLQHDTLTLNKAKMAPLARFVALR